ncbi:META domain-containing protein [Celeribacter neptunius]|uniref:Heat shock protein HslJ n=1 Tax=Celeribacter neptunius TaxID=588602 RepID=A0A1I3S9P0_9RHOB|nr:META domain-containing protein [Celeribacter neptunius]SFJ54329.1 Heat shock protein HslJ [Celeribacter neptunius]
MVRFSHILIFTLLAAPAVAEVPFGFSTRVACDAQHGVVGFAKEVAVLALGEDQIPLSQAISASGARYVSGEGDVEFWIKGDAASLEIGGASQSCTLTQRPWVARGNEPGWLITVADGRLKALLEYGTRELELTPPEAELRDGALWYDLPEMEITVEKALCHDDMTGRPYPEQVMLDLEGTTLRGCAGNTMDLLTGREWRIEDIMGQGVVDNSQTTLLVGADGHLSGKASCNRYMGQMGLTGEGLDIGPLASTRMMCPEALMAQETRYLSALQSVDRFDIDETGALVLYSLDQAVITARR